MHSVEELGTNVPAFLAKLWKMVEDTDTNDLICWSPSGSSFFIRDQARFARELLPLYYKHNNMASFVRQLNMYGFHKVVSIESGGLKVDRDEMEFAHQCFLMGHPYLLEHIKRKIPTNKSEDGRSGTKPELVNKVLSEVKSLKGRQDDVDSQLTAMKRENEVLWREVAILRQKHIKQQQIVNKLIQFLVSMVQTSRGGGIGIKRHYPLMLNDIAHHAKKQPTKINGNLPEHAVSSNASPTGPVIHELDPTELLDDCTPGMEDEAADPEFITSDLCAAAEADATDTATAAASSGATTGANSAASTAAAAKVAADSAETNAVTLNGVELNDPNTEVLLELAEEYPLSPGIVMIPTSSVNFVETRPSKGKQRQSLAKGSKRRKSRVPSSSRPTNPLVAIKTERSDPEEPVNVNRFLEIMLPNLVSEDSVSESTNMETDPLANTLGDAVVLNVLDDAVDLGDEQSALKAATDAAISAISSVAAQTQAASSATTSFNSDTPVQNLTTTPANSPGAVPVNSPPISSPLVISPRGTSPLGTSPLRISPLPASPTMSAMGNSPLGSSLPAASEPDTNIGENNVSGNGKYIDGSKDQDTSNNKNMALACNSAENFKNGVYGAKEDLDVHVDTMQNELESLKELLKGEAYNLDANMLLGVCASGLGLDAGTLKLFGDESLSYGIPLIQEEGGDKESKQNGTSAENLISGNELMTYSSNLLDLADMTEIDDWVSLPNSNFQEDSTDLNTPIVTVNSPCFSGSPTKRRKISK